jgi:hypothetical protein
MEIAVLVPGRTKIQCMHRWKNALKASIGRASGRKGKCEEDEAIKLKAAVQTHGGNKWGSITALVSGRTQNSVVRDGSSCGVVPSGRKTTVEVTFPLCKWCRVT